MSPATTGETFNPSSALREEGGQALAPRPLYHFEVIAEMGSAVAASRYLGIGQAALAKSITRLEADLDTVLFDRSTRPARLTPAGEALLQYVRRMSAEAERLHQTLARARGQQAGTLRIGCGPRWMVDIMPRAIARFVEIFPDMRISVTSGEMGRLSHLLENRDIALMFTSTDSLRRNSHHDVIEMGADHFTIVARRSHPLHQSRDLQLADLMAERWIVSDPGSSSQMILRQMLREAGLPAIAPMVELSDTLAIAATLRRIDCVGIVSNSTMRNLEDIDPLPLAFAMPRSHSGVVHLRGRPLSAQEETFIQLVRDAFAGSTT